MFNKALERPDDGSDTKQLAILYHNAGMAYKAMGQFDKAEELVLKALAINTELKLFQEIASNYYALASIASKNENYEKALEYAVLALESDKRMENRLGIAKDLRALAIINEKAGNTETAYEYYKKAFMVFETLSLADEMRKSLEDLRRIAGILDKPDEAAAYEETIKRLQ